MINARNNYEKSRYAKSQIIAVLREVDAGRKVEKVCLQYGIKSATYNNWKSKYGGMEATDVNRLKELEEENKIKKEEPEEEDLMVEEEPAQTGLMARRV